MKRILLVLALLAVAVPAYAINFSKPLPPELRFLQPLRDVLYDISADELDLLDGVSSSLDNSELDALVGIPTILSCSQGNEYGSIITVTVTMQTAEAAAIAQGGWLILSLSTDSAGKTLVGSSTDFEAAPTVATGGRMTEMGAASVNDEWHVRTSSAGVLTFTAVQDGNETSYLTASMPNGITAACVTLDFD